MADVPPLVAVLRELLTPVEDCRCTCDANRFGMEGDPNCPCRVFCACYDDPPDAEKRGDDDQG